MASFYTRAYTPNRSSQYRDQLNIWCDRIGIAHIQFDSTLTGHYDDQGRQLHQASPIFPSVVSYAARGRSQEEAYRASCSLIPWDRLRMRPESIAYEFQTCSDGSILATPFLMSYGQYAPLTNIVGWGTSRRSAEERAAEMLLCSGHYCFTN
ncbi:hypothetical protein RSOLAG22IIIB_11020 [Rhizoctonia solani]|uniref:Uncharacterized protein n=1 Tax=Rhizoctonia solani TaxID=456999 RepID=A0A0K6G749_9AGAM|nr:hypothetical protein RSOLAG22IIIB_11020 [Rhizoctonia solani]